MCVTRGLSGVDAQVDGILSTKIVIDSGEYLALMFNQARYSN